MNTKLLYVLVSDEDDVYLEQFFVSSFSAKYFMPSCNITLLVDKKTNRSFTEIRKKELKYVDELLVVDLDENLSAQQRSRILKTSSRKYVQGDYIFIDTDTIIVKPFPEDLDQIDSPISACYDSHCSFIDNPYRKMCLNHGKELEWPIEKELEYFNSGVILVKDDPLSYDFFEMWNKQWLLGKEKKVYMDQPSFAKTNYLFNHIVSKLDDRWNCEFKHGMSCFSSAYIIHYLYTNAFSEDLQPFALKDKAIFSGIKSNAEIPQKIIDIIVNPNLGIPNLTTIVSGDDVYIVNSNLHKLIRKLYKKEFLYRVFERIAYSFL